MSVQLERRALQIGSGGLRSSGLWISQQATWSHITPQASSGVDGLLSRLSTFEFIS